MDKIWKFTKHYFLKQAKFKSGQNLRRFFNLVVSSKMFEDGNKLKITPEIIQPVNII